MPKLLFGGRSHIRSATLTASVFSLLIPSAVALDVTVTKLRSTDGTVVVCVWRAADEGFPDCGNGTPFKKAAAPAASPRVSFPDLPPGEYAVSLFHDEKGSGKPERNLVGVPTSGVGLANNPKLGITNRPTFEKGRIQIPQVKSIDIEAQYLF